MARVGHPHSRVRYKYAKSRRRKITCDGCHVLVINNIVCHEHGCPREAAEKKRQALRRNN